MGRASASPHLMTCWRPSNPLSTRLVSFCKSPVSGLRPALSPWLMAVLLACRVQGLLPQAVFPGLPVPPLHPDCSQETTFGESTLSSNDARSAVRTTAPRLLAHPRASAAGAIAVLGIEDVSREERWPISLHCIVNMFRECRLLATREGL